MPLKKTQVKGEKHLLPEEEVEVEKLIRKGLRLDQKVREAKAELEAVKARLTEIATERRDGQTTVKLTGVSGQVVTTFRETWEPGDGIEDVSRPLGDLFTRFFKREVKWKAEKDLKAFMAGEQSFGLDDPDGIRDQIRERCKLKIVKPNVKLVAAG